MLLPARCTDAEEEAYEFDEDGSDDDRHDDAYENARNLRDHLSGVAGEESVRACFIDSLGAEDAGHESAPYAAHTVATEGVQRVVVFEMSLDAGDEEVADARRGEADEEGRRAVHEARCGGDADEAGYDAGHEADGGDFLMDEFIQDRPDEAGGAGSDARIGQRLRHHSGGREACAGVEAEPAEPEEAGAEADIGDIVRTNGCCAEVFPFSDEDGCGESGEAGRYMNDGAAGEVQRAHIADEAAYAPDHVAHRVIHEGAPQQDEEAVCGETRPFHDAAGNDGRRQDGEGHLEHAEQDVWDGGGVIRVGFHTYAIEEGPVQIPDDAAHIRAEGQRISEKEPLHGEDGQADEGHHHRIQRVFAAYEAAIEKAERRRHDEDQQRRHSHIRHIAGREFAPGSAAKAAIGIRAAGQAKSTDRFILFFLSTSIHRFRTPICAVARNSISLSVFPLLFTGTREMRKSRFGCPRKTASLRVRIS